MAAAAILDLGKFAYLPSGIDKGYRARFMLLKFCGNRFILAKTISIFQNSRLRPPPSQILKNYVWHTGSKLAGNRCLLLKFGENCFILAETINIFRISRWRPPPSWIFENSHICPRGSIKVSARCILLKFGGNRFILAELLIFFEIQDGGRRHLGFWKIRISTLGDR